MTIESHPFETRPNRTLIALSLPVLLSLTAEPITALVDTAFVSSLGVDALAALGIGTTALSSLFWIFNFLGIGTQTEVAQRFGKGQQDQTGQIASLALILAAGFGLLLIAVIYPASGWLAGVLGGDGEVRSLAVSYMQIRLFGAPAVLVILTGFGALRGVQDMRSPLWIALGMNALNLALDWVLVFGPGPFPEMGVAGSALASTISQWLGAAACLLVVGARAALSFRFSLREAGKLLRVGGDIFARTALLNLFLAYTTRAANGLGADTGAAHQVIRQVYLFTSLALDAFASTVQSLVGYFVGRGSVSWARRVVRSGVLWSLGTGAALGLSMWLGKEAVINLLVPAASVAVFLPAWGISALTQPISGLAFLTDGAHWGIGDYKFLRNAMIAATVAGMAGIWLVETQPWRSFLWIWVVTGVWVLLRGTLGILRVWPGIGNGPFSSPGDRLIDQT